MIGRAISKSRKFIIQLILCFMFLAAFSCAHEQEIVESKRTDIAKLLEITGVLDIAEQMLDSLVQDMMQLLKSARPDLPEWAFDQATDEVNQVIKENIPNLIDLMIPIYDKHLTDEEIKGLLAFYESELGKKVIKLTPQLMKEGMAAGRELGKSLSSVTEDRVMKRLEREVNDFSSEIAALDPGLFSSLILHSPAVAKKPETSTKSRTPTYGIISGQKKLASGRVLEMVVIIQTDQPAACEAVKEKRIESLGTYWDQVQGECDSSIGTHALFKPGFDNEPIMNLYLSFKDLSGHETRVNFMNATLNSAEQLAGLARKQFLESGVKQVKVIAPKVKE